MIKYAFPAYEDGDMVIRTVVAKSTEDAETEIMNYYSSMINETVEADNWSEFIQYLDDNYSVLIGEMVELSSLEDEAFEINLK